MDIRLDGKRTLVTGGNSGIPARLLRSRSRALAHGSRSTTRRSLRRRSQSSKGIEDQHGEAVAIEADVVGSGGGAFAMFAIPRDLGRCRYPDQQRRY